MMTTTPLEEAHQYLLTGLDLVSQSDEEEVVAAALEAFDVAKKRLEARQKAQAAIIAVYQALMAKDALTPDIDAKLDEAMKAINTL